MGDNLKETVDWFLKNLDWQLEDIRCEKDNISVELYFDTADVRNAVLGMHAFYTPEHGFQLEDFFRYNDKTLMHALLSSGWIGDFRMLPPHQAEFLNLLNLDFGVGVERDPKGRAREFFRELQSHHALSGKNISPDEDLLGYVQNHAGSAMNLFKAVQCIRGTWQTRLVRWHEKHLLHLDAARVDYARLLKLPHFSPIKNAFEVSRPGRSVINVADSVAVCLLIDSLRKFERGESRGVPRFMVPTNLFRDAIRAAKVETQLEYKSRKGTMISALRTPDYCVFKAFFRPPSEVLSAAGEPSYFSESVDLEKLREDVYEILQAQQPLTEDAVNRIDVVGKPLGEVISAFRMASFLDNVWLPFSAKSDVQNALIELGAEEPRHPQLRQKVERAIRDTKDALEKNVREYKRVSSLWSKLERASEWLRTRVRKDTDQSVDVFRDFALLRFGFPKSAHRRVEQVLEAFLSGNEREETEARSLAIAAYYVGADHPNEEQSSLVLAAAVLWTARLDKELIDLFSRLKVFPHYSLKVVYVAALFRSRRHLDRGRTVLRDLERQLEQTKNAADCASLSVAIAYLHFHLWIRLGFNPFWRSKAQTITVPAEEGEVLAQKAIAYAKRALELLAPGGDRLKMVYALNQYLYYMIEGGEDTLKDEINRIARELPAYKADPYLWQYRFDDTLARYFHRLATAARNEEEWTDLMNEAKRQVELASDSSLGDEEIESYRSILVIDKAAGYQLQNS
jgi:hypothetical protein